MRSAFWFVALATVVAPGVAFASSSEGGHGVSPTIWFVVAAMLVAAKLGGQLAVWLGQPPVLGELFAGIVLGNLDMVGVHVFEQAATTETVSFLAELGVVLLLFEVGLESTVADMREVIPSSGAVAVVGVVAPMVLGYGASMLAAPHATHVLHLFIGATLAATSVGITARVLRDLGALGRPETRVILGAAVIDDVLGLIVLSVVTAIAQEGTVPSPMHALQLLGLAAAFLIGALLVGRYVTPGVFRIGARLQTEGVLSALAIALCLSFAGLSALSGLAAIVGAFAAGLVLDEVHVRPFGSNTKHDIAELIRPTAATLAPIFFVRTGVSVDLHGATLHVLLLAALLGAAAVGGKLIAGIGMRTRGADRLLVGIGMLPRGEVGLIFADAGARIRLDGHPLIEPSIYMAIILVIMGTTVAAPPWLAARLRRTLGPGLAPPLKSEAAEE
ncbi:cation:proton antiporter [Pendulispora brunnea]|uniref:Cation:proton antiporter n=1 Tax=Pendulispora brunnea TaxID=2905690 RepID=A0ABZ2KN72_9BACT